MSVDREQIRRQLSLLVASRENLSPHAIPQVAADCLWLLAELEQAERERDVLRESEAEWQRRGDRALTAEARTAKADELAEAANRRAIDTGNCPICDHVGISYYRDGRWSEEPDHFPGCALGAYEQKLGDNDWPVRPGVVANDDPERWG